MERSVVYVYDDIFSADLAMTKLREDGVEAIVEKIETLVSNPIKKISYNLLVPLYELEKTIIVLDQLDNS